MEIFLAIGILLPLSGLDPDLKVYLEGSSDEIPFRYPIELCFTLPPGSRSDRLEEETKQGLKNSFNFKRYLLGKELKQVNARILRFIVIGFIFLGVGGMFSKRAEDLILISTLLEGIFIAGWVFLWEAVSLFFFTNRDMYHRYQTYKRLQNAPVIFKEAAVI